MDLEVSQQTYNEDTQDLLDIINDIITSGEIKEEDKNNLNTNKATYNSSYTQVNKDIKDTERSYQDGQFDYIKDQLMNLKSQIVKNDDLIQFSVSGTVGNEEYISQILVELDKIGLLVTDGDNESGITITPLLIKLIAESDIQLSAKKILINGLLEGAGWRISEEGDLDINDLNIRGTLSCENINVDNIISAGVPTSLYNTIDINVSSGETVSQYLDDIPLNLNGYSVNIYLSADTTENLELRRHMNGIVNIYLCGYSIKGTLRGNFNNSIYNIYGGSNTTDTIQGKIMPYDGYNIGLYYYSLIFNNCPNVNLYNLKVYGAKTNSENTVCIGGQQKSKIYMENITFVGAKYNVRTYSMAELYCDSSSGKSSGNSWSAGTGSRITLNAANQAGGGNNTYTSGNGQIISSGAIFSDTADTSSNTNTSTSTTTTRVATFKPNYADTYRSTVYNNWKRDGVARQGDWGYGDCNGCAFYGTQFAEVKGKDITKVTISVKRSGGVGNSSSVSHTFQAHSHTSRPSGSPTLLNCNKTLDLAWDESGTVTITDADILAKLKTGVIKGFGIKSAFDKAHYSALTNWTVKIYYKE